MSGAAAALAALRRGCDALAAGGRRLDVWWRDDDAVADTPALARLLAVARAHRCPISLAAIPALAQPSLHARLRDDDAVTVLVHGWRHVNRAAAGDRSAEFGADRPLEDLACEAACALATVEQGFGARARPVFVPPWNRIAPGMIPRLATLGYRGLSCFGEAGSAGPPVRIDTHLDPVDWRGARTLLAPEAMAAMFQRAVSRGSGAIGILTHHLVHDETLWGLCEGMAELAATHPALRAVGIDDLLAAAPRASARIEEPA